ncbi:hypothetical protein DL98DRAFT_534033 [Cadophora sp. DSE1049]|nr:hypothetical protein DL98DRAFT_534033 [Cadophora sp. DSE1049]
MSALTSSPPTSTHFRGPKVDFSNPSPLVTVTVGSGSRAKDFTIHQEIICFYSPYFREVFQSGHLKVDMLAVDAQVFGLLTHWLYTQEIRLSESNLAKKSKNVVTTHLLPLTKLWSLARQCDMPGLQNIVMDRLAPILDTINIVDVSAFIMHICKDNKTEGTQIRALAIHHAARHMTPEVLKKIGLSAPREMLFDISMAFLQHNDLVHNSDRYEIVDPSKFHVGIPEVEDELLDDEVSETECEEPEEEEDESAPYEHFGDESDEIAEHVMEMAEPCEGDFEKADAAEVEQDEELVHDPCDMVGIADLDVLSDFAGVETSSSDDTAQYFSSPCVL